MKGWQEYAIVIILGLLVSFGVTAFLFVRSDRNPAAIPTPAPVSLSPEPVTSLPEKQVAPIILTSPEDEAVFDNKAITIAGEASPEALVVVFVNQKNFVVTSDKNGNFALDVNLESGSNAIRAVMVDDQGATYSDNRLVVYTNKSLEEILLTQEEFEEMLQEKVTDANDKKGQKTWVYNLHELNLFIDKWLFFVRYAWQKKAYMLE